jgi:hypothetical protein
VNPEIGQLLFQISFGPEISRGVVLIVLGGPGMSMPREITKSAGFQQAVNLVGQGLEILETLITIITDNQVERLVPVMALERTGGNILGEIPVKINVGLVHIAEINTIERYQRPERKMLADRQDFLPGYILLELSGFRGQSGYSCNLRKLHIFIISDIER